MTTPIHIINPLWDPAGGSEWRAVQLYRDLRCASDVRLWSQGSAVAPFTALAPVHFADPQGNTGPKGGTLIVVGTYFELGLWLERMQPERVIVIHNVLEQRLLQRVCQRFEALGLAIEIVYTSELTRQLAGKPGRVQYSPIDLQRFTPGARRPRRSFTVGRLSRNVALKHHHEDPSLYRALLTRGFCVRLMGADILRTELAPHPRLGWLAAGAEDAKTFLQSLDCLIFRTSEAWTEPFGRVVIEAMACGLPVVAARRGGYCEIMHEDVDGLLFDRTSEALDHISRLRDEPELARSLGQAARAATLRLYSPAQARLWREYFIKTP